MADAFVQGVLPADAKFQMIAVWIVKINRKVERSVLRMLNGTRKGMVRLL